MIFHMDIADFFNKHIPDFSVNNDISYVDISALTTPVRNCRTVIRALSNIVRGLRDEEGNSCSPCAVTARGDSSIIASLLADKQKLPFIPIFDSAPPVPVYVTSSEEGMLTVLKSAVDCLPAHGPRDVVLYSDLVAIGNEALAVSELFKKARLYVTHVVSLINIPHPAQERFEEAGISITSLVTGTESGFVATDDFGVGMPTPFVRSGKELVGTKRNNAVRHQSAVRHADFTGKSSSL